MTAGVLLGTAWYPDQMPRERWADDARLMREAGLSLVRLGEFLWTLYEPRAGEIDLGFLDEALGALAAEGLRAVVCTPTAELPAWLVEANPEVSRTGPDGRRAVYAMESRSCLTAPALLEAVDRIVGALANRFGQDPRVAAWQVDNELSAPCYCESCARAFRSWLETRYGSLEELNRRWGTTFRNERYTAWSQIPLASPEVRWLNPALGLDRRRFHSDMFVRFNARQAAILREGSEPGRPVTHNLIPPALGAEIDYCRLAADLDVVGWDDYPSLEAPPRATRAAFEADFVRASKRRRFWVLEMQAGAVGLERVTTARPGQPRLWALQAVAHGAEALFVFRWRTARFGAEQHWGGVLEWNGRRGEAFRSLARLSADLGALGDLLEGLEPRADAAVVHDYDARWALEEQPTNDALAYAETLLRHHRALARLGVGLDVVGPEADLSRYRLVAAPNLYVADAETAARMRAFVEAGGTLVLAPRLAFKDRDSAVPERPLPAWFDELAGVEVVEFQSVASEETVAFAGEVSGEAAGWYERVELRDAEVLATFEDGAFAGASALTRRRAGAGAVVYAAGALTDAAADRLYEWLAPESGLQPQALPEDVEAVRATNAAGRDVLFLLNHADGERSVALDGREWALDGSPADGILLLPAYGVAVGVRGPAATR